MGGNRFKIACKIIAFINVGLEFGTFKLSIALSES